MVEIRYVDFYKWAVANGIKCNDRLVADVIYYHSFVHGECWLSKARIVEHTGLSSKSVQRSIACLESRGLVSTNRGNGRTAIEFKLNVKVVTESLHVDSQTTSMVTQSTPMVTQSIGHEIGIKSGALWSHSPYPMVTESTPMVTQSPQRNIQEQEVLSCSSSTKDLKTIAREAGPPPYDQWVSDEFSRFGYHLPIPVSQNIAARTLMAMSREYGEQYITDRLSELTGRPQAAVVKYILQDGASWLQRKLNPPPAREQRARANRREIYRDPQFVNKPFPTATTDEHLDEMFGPDPSKAKP